jgi:ubiquitin-like 1-activating enzyme E1 A
MLKLFPFSLLSTNYCDRLRSAKILLITFKALANEIAKNLVLAGIGSLTILDHESVTEVDLCAQFFISGEHVGQNVRLS